MSNKKKVKRLSIENDFVIQLRNFNFLSETNDYFSIFDPCYKKKKN